MEKRLKVAIVGAGNRGQVYVDIMAEMPEKYEVVAVAECLDSRRDYVKQTFGIPDDRCFTDWQGMFALGKIADLVVIATSDTAHFEPAMAAIQLGYNILLEKPVAPTAKECEQVARAAEEKGVNVLVCHVLRYTPFFNTIKKLLLDGAIGEVCSIDHREHVGFVHQSHSYVRGKWGALDRSAFMLLAKSCHDLDIIQWLLDKKCLHVQSFGGLHYFVPKNKPEGSPERCIDGCPVGDTCPFNAVKLYLKKKSEWYRGACTGIVNATDEQVEHALRTNQYGKCVFCCDNEVVDRQTVNMLFEDGVTVTFSMNAFNSGGRHIHIFGTKGELWGSMDNREEPIRVREHATKEVTEYHVGGKEGLVDDHCGGDHGIVEALHAYMCGTYDGYAASDIRVSVDNHHLCFAAEQSRLENRVIDMDEYIKSL